MNIIRRTKRIVETIVVFADPGDPELLKLVNPDSVNYEGWIVDWHIGRKYVLTRDTTLPLTDGEAV